MNISFFLSTSFLFSVLVMLIVGTASVHYVVAGDKLRASADMPPEQAKVMREQAKMDVMRITIGLLFAMLLFILVYMLRPELSTNTVGLSFIQASAGTAQCGDTPQNLCKLPHLLVVFASLFPDWLTQALGNL